MARQWFIPAGIMPLSGVMVDEDGEEEYFVPALGALNEDQAADTGTPLIMPGPLFMGMG